MAFIAVGGTCFINHVKMKYFNYYLENLVSPNKSINFVTG